MPSLLDLPSELVEQVISVLADEKPPSAKLLYEEPSYALMQSCDHPLKDLSQACRATRELCFPSLFSAVKVNLDCVAGFLDFSARHSLSSHVDSFVLYTDPNYLTEKFNHLVSNAVVCNPIFQVIDSVKPSVTMALLPPSMIAQILPYQLNLEDEWAFDIPYQVLQLRMPRDLVPVSQISKDVKGSWNIFQMFPWTHCTFNQGSSIKGYSTYEFFSKQEPSLFHPLHHDSVERTMTKGSFETLTTFDYIAVFPINHIVDFCMCLDLMRNLKCLRTQLAPTPRNAVLDNPTAMGKCQPNDLWQEFESCYDSLAYYVGFDWSNGPNSFEEFVSLDYANPSLRELVDRGVGRHLVTWESDPNGGRWTLKEKRTDDWDQ